MYRLYGSFTSPYVRKVRAFAREKQLLVELVPVDTSAPNNAAVALNPLGKVPVLERQDGWVLFDSPVAVEYLDSLASPALIPPVGETRWEVLRWQALADGILDATVTRFLETRRPAAQQAAEAMARQEEKINRALAHAERELGGREWIVENRLTLADVALAVALEYVDFRYSAEWRKRHARLAAWLEPISDRPSMGETRPPRA